MKGGASLVQSGRFSPLRYPGGKGKLAAFLADLVRENHLVDGTYVEPYAGGAAIAWELLLTGIVRRVEVNDVSWPIFAFWSSVLDNTEEFCRLIHDCSIDLSTWDRCKAAFREADQHDALTVGFAAFFLNRTNRSGILNGGIIGGRAQNGAWKIDARFNKLELVARIERIASLRSRIALSNLDAVEFLQSGCRRWKPKTLVYLDPPYFVKGGQLYYDSYRPSDHKQVSDAVHSYLSDVSWIVSYDDVDPIHGLYGNENALRYSIGYSARHRGHGAEAMFFSRGLKVPAVRGSMIEIDRSRPIADNDIGEMQAVSGRA